MHQSKKSCTISLNIPQLQNLIKRDAESYRDDFLRQFRHYESLMEVCKLRPESPAIKDLQESIMFLAHVSHCYPDVLVDFPGQLHTILGSHASVMNPELRMAMCKALMLLRRKDKLEPIRLLELFFDLLRCQDKVLRKTLYDFIVSDIKGINFKHRNLKVNSSLQSFMYSMMSDSNPRAARLSLDVMMSLYKSRIWNDAKTVNAITQACFSKIMKLRVAALHFFLGQDQESPEEDDSDDDDKPTMRSLMIANKVTKKTKKRQKKYERAVKTIKKQDRKFKPEPFNFSAIHLIYDPQDFAEKLFKMVETSNGRFEVKIMILSLVSRLIGIHQLFLFNFYPYLQRFLNHRQQDVTKILMFLAQASHGLVPPDVIEPVLKTIANNFVTDRNTSDVIAIGLNSIREICGRCPLSMDKDLLSDLAGYKTSRDRSVMMAARSLIMLYRVLQPDLLNKKDRGQSSEASREIKPLQYGEEQIDDDIPGVEALTEKEEILSDDQSDIDGSDVSASDEDNDAESVELSDVEDDSEEVLEADGDEEDGVDASDRKKEATRISSSRFLSEEDFVKIRKHQMLKHVQVASRKRKRADPVDLDSENEPESKELVSLEDIEMVHRRGKLNKEARIAAIQEGRTDRTDKHRYRVKRMNAHASTTNKEKAKKKPFAMLKAKVKVKSKRSFREKQMSLRDALVKKLKTKR